MARTSSSGVAAHHEVEAVTQQRVGYVSFRKTAFEAAGAPVVDQVRPLDDIVDIAPEILAFG